MEQIAQVMRVHFFFVESSKIITHFVISDINECYNVNMCDINAQCTNTPGSYQCTCNLGYEKRGDICTGKMIPIL